MTPEPDATTEPDDAPVPADELSDDGLDNVAGGAATDGPRRRN